MIVCMIDAIGTIMVQWTALDIVTALEVTDSRVEQVLHFQHVQPVYMDKTHALPAYLPKSVDTS